MDHRIVDLGDRRGVLRAGAVVVAAQRSVLSAGVMIALALIPTATITGMAIAMGELDVAGAAARRWLLEVAIVTVIASLVLFAKQSVHQKRRARD